MGVGTAEGFEASQVCGAVDWNKLGNYKERKNAEVLCMLIGFGFSL